MPPMRTYLHDQLVDVGDGAGRLALALGVIVWCQSRVVRALRAAADATEQTEMAVLSATMPTSDAYALGWDAGYDEGWRNGHDGRDGVPPLHERRMARRRVEDRPDVERKSGEQ